MPPLDASETEKAVRAVSFHPEEHRRGGVHSSTSLLVNNMRAMTIVLLRLVESVTHHAVLTELPADRTAALSEELTDMVLRYLQD